MASTIASSRIRRRWEVGSEFHWMDTPVGPRQDLPVPHVLFALAQHAVWAIWRSLSVGTVRPALWVPDYFCPPVVDVWTSSGIPVRRYTDDPRWPQPEWASLHPGPGDLVLAVNYFGNRTGEGWRRWQVENDGVLLLEDHSHDPFSAWAQTSRANYAIASLRKTLPIADGAIAWSPAGLALPAQPAGQDWSGSALKLAAMIWKRAYLDGSALAKVRYRVLQKSGEAALLHSVDLAIAPWSRELLEAGVPTVWRQRRDRNVRLFFSMTSEDRRFRPVAAPAPCIVPFNAVIVFDSGVERELVRKRLIRERVYGAVHWAQPLNAPARVEDLAKRILTIPVDQRYDETEVARICEILTSPDHSARAKPEWRASEPALD